MGICIGEVENQDQPQTKEERKKQTLRFLSEEDSNFQTDSEIIEFYKQMEKKESTKNVMNSDKNLNDFVTFGANHSISFFYFFLGGSGLFHKRAICPFC